jgi:hypothetical protein
MECCDRFAVGGVNQRGDHAVIPSRNVIPGKGRGS